MSKPEGSEDRPADPIRIAGEVEPVRLPPWLPAVLYAVVTAVLFRKFVFSDAMLFGGDTNALGYMARAFYASAVEGGVFPRWNPYILGGTPFIESLAGGDSLYPTSLLLWLMEPYRALGWKLVLHVFLAGLFMYGWLRSLGASRAASIVAGLAYLLAPFMVTLVLPGHDGKLFVTALTPLLFWATESVLRRGRMGAAAGVGGVVAVVLLSTHFQTAYFLFGGVGIYAIARSVQTWRDKALGRSLALTRFGLFMAASLLGAGAASVQLIPAVQYVTDHSRRTATTTEATAETAITYSSSWSMHPEEVMALAVPEFVGSSSLEAAWGRGTYWGRNAFKGNHEYVGLVVLLLAGLSFCGAARRGVRWTLFGIGTLALFFTVGRHTPVWRIMYEVLPGISLFRAPSIAIFLFGFPAVTLAGLGLDRALATMAEDDRERDKGLRRTLWITVAVLGIGTILANTGVLTSVWIATIYRGIEPDKLQALEAATPFIVRGFFVATLLAAGVATSLWAGRKRYLNASGVTVLVGVLIALDLFRVDDPFIRVQDFEQFTTPDQNVEFLIDRLAEEEPFRIVSLMDGAGQDVTPAMYGIELASGHHPNDLARYRDLIGMVGSGAPMNLLTQPNVLRMLNVRYFLWPDYRGAPFEQIRGELTRVSQLRFQDGRPYASVYAYPGLARVRLVGDVVVIPDEAAVEFMLSSDFDPETQVVLAEDAPPTVTGGLVQGSVTWLERGINEQRLEVTSDRAALLVVADNWFPSARAEVNGVETPVLRANYQLRALVVPPGESTVRLFYASSTLTGSFWLTLMCTALLVSGAGVGFARTRRETRARA